MRTITDSDFDEAFKTALSQHGVTPAGEIYLHPDTINELRSEILLEYVYVFEPGGTIRYYISYEGIMLKEDSTIRTPCSVAYLFKYAINKQTPCGCKLNGAHELWCDRWEDY